MEMNLKTIKRGIEEIGSELENLKGVEDFKNFKESTVGILGNVKIEMSNIYFKMISFMDEAKEANERAKDIQVMIDRSMIKELSMRERGELDRIRKQRMGKLLGSPNSPRYRVFSRLYFRQMAKDVYIAFGKEDSPLSSYGAIKREQFEDAKDFVRNWTPDEEELKKKAVKTFEKKEEKITKAKKVLAEKQGMMTTSEVSLAQAKIVKMEEGVEPYRELKEEALNK